MSTSDNYDDAYFTLYYEFKSLLQLQLSHYTLTNRLLNQIFDQIRYHNVHFERYSSGTCKFCASIGFPHYYALKLCRSLAQEANIEFIRLSHELEEGEITEELPSCVQSTTTFDLEILSDLSCYARHEYEVIL